MILSRKKKLKPLLNSYGSIRTGAIGRDVIGLSSLCKLPKPHQGVSAGVVCLRFEVYDIMVSYFKTFNAKERDSAFYLPMVAVTILLMADQTDEEIIDILNKNSVTFQKTEQRPSLKMSRKPQTKKTGNCIFIARQRRPCADTHKASFAALSGSVYISSKF